MYMHAYRIPLELVLLLLKHRTQLTEDIALRMCGVSTPASIRKTAKTPELVVGLQINADGSPDHSHRLQKPWSIVLCWQASRMYSSPAEKLTSSNQWSSAPA